MISEMDFKEKLDFLKKKPGSCVENVKYFLSNIEKNNKNFNIFLEVLKDSALKRAEELELKKKENKNLGRLFGVVFAVKSNISIKNSIISCASKTLDNYKGSFNADVINKILDEDGIIIGILNNDEFASGSSGETSYFGKTINPFSPKRVPGGSSSGSAAAVSANMCDVSLGSDTGGSIRLPASFCNVIGIKPSYGRVSRYGLVDLSMSLDQIGPLSKDVLSSSLVMEIISGYSENDPTTKKIKVDSYSGFINDNSKILKIGISSDLNNLIVDEEIKESFENLLNKLKKEGYSIFDVNLKNSSLGVQAYYPIVYTEFFSGTRKFDSIKFGKEIDKVGGEEVLRRILGGKEISKSEFDGAYYKKALKVRNIISEEFSEAFSNVDIILLPTAPKLPHKFTEKISTEEMYKYDVFTIPSNLAGVCAASIPMNIINVGDENISIGLQIIANSFREDNLFKGLSIIEGLKK